MSLRNLKASGSRRSRSAPAASGTPQSRRRHRLLAAGLVPLAILVLVVLPGYLAAQPRFFERFPTLTEEYSPWSVSSHAEVGCEGCHVPPTPLDRGIYRLRMVGGFYGSLVSKAKPPDVFSPPTNRACLACHSGMRSVSPKGDLQIPHRAHVSILKMPCVECHSYLVHELSPEGKHTPPMIGCLECHDGDTAEDACTACHTTKAAPASHSDDTWLVLHAEQSDDPACDECHGWREGWCVDCHQDRPESHGTDWRAVHGERVAEHRNCESCHATDTCVRCHGEVPQLDFDPTRTIVQ